MKRLLFAFFAAMGIHGLFFVWEFDLTQSRLSADPEHRTLHMTLTCLAPAKPTVKLVEKPPVPRPSPPVQPPDPPPKKDKAPQPVQPVKTAPMPAPQVKPPEEESLATLPETPSQSLPLNEASGPVQPANAKELTEKTNSENVASGSVNSSNIVREAVPMYKDNTPPTYPRWARKRGWEGTVLLEILVDTQGRAKDVRIHESSGYEILDETATSTARKWRFVPGMRGDFPVEMWVRVPVTFQLQ